MSSFRVTTGMMMNTYRYNLQGSTKNMDGSRNKVLTHRKFNSYAEDPAAATHAWRLRRAFSKNDSYLVNNSDAKARMNIAWTTLGTIKTELYDKAATTAELRGSNDPTADGREPLGTVLNNTAKAIIQAMNGAKYGDHFVFGGDDALNAPFTWSEDGKTLYYQGVNVNAGLVKKPAEPDWGAIDPATNLPENMPAQSDDAMEQAWIDYYNDQAANGAAGTVPKPSDPPNWGTEDKYGVPEQLNDPNFKPNGPIEEAWAAYYKDQGDVKRLDELANAQVNTDLGMGLMEDENGKVVNGTAFDMSLPGIKMLGYGVDADGDPKNGVMIIMRLGEILDGYNSETDKFEPPENREEYDRLIGKLSDANDLLISSYSDTDTKGQYLNANEDRLKDQSDYLAEEILNLEQVDLVDAIMEFSWDYYCYSAALKIGTQLLSQSLIDYMR